MDMTLFEQIYQLASTDIKETAGKLKEYKKTDFATIITDADKIINDNKQDIRDLEHFEKTLQTNREKAQQQIVDLIEQKQPTTYEGADIEELEETETTLVSEIEQLQLDIESVESDISIINESIKTVQETNDNVDINRNCPIREFPNREIPRLGNSTPGEFPNWRIPKFGKSSIREFPS